MKIMICGSMAFIKDILNVKKKLDRLGHTALIPFGTEPHLIDSKGYIGVPVLMEMAVAHYLNKKAFILNAIPHFDKHRWAQEVKIMQPIIIHGDLNKIN